MSRPASGYVDPVDLRVQARSQSKSLGRLWHLVRMSLSIVWASSRSSFLASITMQLIQAVLLAAQVWAVKILLEALLDPDANGAAAAIGPIILLAAVTAAGAILGAAQGSVNRFLGECVSRRMADEVLAVAGAVPLRFFESPLFYDRLSRVQAGAASRPYQVAQALMSMAGSAATTVTVGISLIAIYPPLALLLVLGGVPIYLTNRRISKLEFQFMVENTPSSRMRSYLMFLQANRDAAKEIRAFDLSESLLGRYERSFVAYLRRLKTHLRRIIGLSLLGNSVTALILAATLLSVVWLIATDRISVAAAGAAIVAIRLLQGQIQGLYGGMQSILESGLFLDDVEDFLRMGREQSESVGTATAPANFSQLAANDVTFTYPGTDRPALDGVSMTVGRGEVVALVGENGSGKTTLAKLMAGLYDPDAGQVTWDGTPLHDLEPGSLRERVAVIFQDFVRFAFSARDNIAPRGDVVDAQVWEAARAAGAEGAIQDLPDGLDTMLSRMFRGGVELSGGQWQRIAIARAFYKDAPVVILDEPTSSLDARAEHELFQTLRGTLHGRSAVFISHRFSTVREADRIVVLDRGRVIEQGSHAELMALDGAYADLFRLQASAYTGEVDTGPPARLI